MVQPSSDPIDAAAAATLKAAMSAAAYYFACSHHVGGLCVGNFTSYSDAKDASDAHKAETGHSDCYPSGGTCPF